METFEHQIQPFIKPLIDRIQVLEDENKQLKVAIDELKEKGQKVGNDNKHNRTQTEATINKPGVGRPVTTKPNVEPKQPVGVKKQIKVPERQPLTNVDKTKTPLSGKKQIGNSNDVKEPKTDRKQPAAKVVTSPKPIKGKQTSNTVNNVPTNKVNGIKPADTKDLKPPATKVNPPKSIAANKNPTQVNKSNPPKTQIKAQTKQINAQNQQLICPVQPVVHVSSTQIKQQEKPQQQLQKGEQLVPKIQTLQQTLPVDSKPEQQSNKDQDLLEQTVQPPKTSQNSQPKQAQITQQQEQQELI